MSTQALETVENKIAIENTSTLGRKLTVNVTAEKLKAEEQGKIEKYAKNMRLDGFRRGKIPSQLINQRYGKQVHQEIISDQIEAGLRDALISNGLNPVGQPVVEEIKDNSKDNGDLEFVVTFEIFPDFELKPFAEIELEKQVVTVSDADVAENIAKLQDQFATWEKVERKVESGDKVNIDFVGKIEGKEFEHGSAQDFDLEIGSNRFIPGFEDGLIAAEVRKKSDVKVTFPENYGEKSLAGKDVVFEVTVNNVFAKAKAELDQEFAKKIGVEDGSVDKVNSKVKEGMEKQVEYAANEKLRQSALDKLLEAYSFELPKALLDREKQALSEEWKHKNPSEEVDQVVIEENAKKRVTMSLVIQKIIEQYKLEPDQARIQQKIEEFSSILGNPEMIRKMYTESKELYEGLKGSVLTDQVAELIVEGAIIKNEPATFAEITTKA